MLTSLLATKFYTPRPTASLVARPRLTQRLDDSLRQGHRLILVTGPAGYGKTTLVADWLSSTKMPFAWLSLDEGDNDLARFFAYLVAALQKLDPQVGQSALDMLPAMPQSHEALVNTLINDIAAADQPFVLVLDDYHVITSVVVQEAMNFLIEHIPPNLHLVIVTRADPPFPLPRLRVREEMTEIRDRDLRFTREEMTAFLNSIHHLGLPAEQIAALESRTEGWAAGVQLAALSLHGCDVERAAQLIQAFSGSHHYIIDYLADEVFRRQPANVQTFLLRTSILNRLTAPLCDTVTGQVDGSATLQYLERTHLFLIPLDDERRWYRYHHLFSGFLQARLRETEPEHWSALHRQAAQWYEQQGLFEDAVNYAMAAEDYATAIRLIEQPARRVLERQGISRMLSWIQALPTKMVYAHPSLCVDYAWSLAHSGHLDQVEPLLQVMESALDDARRQTDSAPSHLENLPPHPPTTYESYRGSRLPVLLDLLRACVERFRDLPRAKALCERALQRIPAGELYDHSIALFFLGHIHLLSGDTVQTRQTLLEAIRESKLINLTSVYLSSINYLVQQLVLEGKLKEAMSMLAEAMQYVEEQPEPLLAGIERIRCGDVQREWDNVSGAAENIQAGLHLAEAGGDFVFLRDGYIAQARLEQALGNLNKATFYLQKANQVTHQTETSRGIAPVKAMQARLWLAMGDLSAAERWATNFGPDPAGELHFLNEYNLLTLARLWMAQRRWGDAGRLLERLLPFAESAGRIGRVIEALAMQALVRKAQGDPSGALDALESALALAEPQGLIRTFVDEGQAMRDLLRLALAQGVAPAYTARLVSAFSGPAASLQSDLRPPSAELVEPLSEHELRVLRLVAAGLSNQQVAQELVVTVGTVKKHLNNIFGKLGVKSRTQTIARARELHLLA